MKLLLAAFAFVVALWLFGRRKPADEWLVINWRDLEGPDYV